MRERLTQEAARVMAEQGVGDYQLAKRKAAAHLGAEDTRNLPQNREIQAALATYQALFGGEARGRRIRELFDTAIEAMGFFQTFRPRLVGALLDGTAGAYGVVNLHLFADTPEQVVLFLLDNDIPYESDERRVRFDDEYYFQPMHRFLAGGVPVEVTVFDDRALRQPPRSQVDGRPMRRAALPEVRALRAAAPAD